jgi:hypothetical protein
MQHQQKTTSILEFTISIYLYNTIDIHIPLHHQITNLGIGMVYELDLNFGTCTLVISLFFRPPYNRTWLVCQIDDTIPTLE